MYGGGVLMGRKKGRVGGKGEGERMEDKSIVVRDSEFM